MLQCMGAKQAPGGGSGGAPDNLGVLRSVIEQDATPPDAYGMQRVSPASFAERGLYMDGASIGSSALLLVVLLALTFQRILGLDRLINQALADWKERRELARRSEVVRAREGLESSWSRDDDEDGGA
ncbi:hypothetical protein HT031_002224 [Scenedesmus sp. PABB004]|nr:hypothetical protein HT031_002224 [Scenedesmus sp. PABB004]